MPWPPIALVRPARELFFPPSVSNDTPTRQDNSPLRTRALWTSPVPLTGHLMRGLRLERWSGQWFVARPGAWCASQGIRPSRRRPCCPSIRDQSTAAAAEYDRHYDGLDLQRFPPLEQVSSTEASYPSPIPERALKSAKLAALHARLSLPPAFPLQTLARTLIDHSADENPRFNNNNLAFAGYTLINYHVGEWLMCRYPRLPMNILYSAMKGFAGRKPLHQTALSWGVDSAAVPGGEVDPGLLQFDAHKQCVSMSQFGYFRKEVKYIKKFKWRRGINSRVIFDDEFGDMAEPNPDADASDDGGLDHPTERSYMTYGTESTRERAEEAHAQFVRALVGALYAHCGRELAKSFVRAHILSRTLDVSRLFGFSKPTKHLALLCEREDFERPVARLLSETGRLSRTPVFVVGIFSGRDKLGEGSAHNLDAARWKAAINSLKAWYLYSPGEDVRVPSDMAQEGAKPWNPVYIDMGEIITQF